MRFQLCLAKLIVDHGFEDVWRKKDPDCFELTYYDRCSGTRSKINRDCADITIANNTNSNHIMIPFTDHYNAISLDRFPSKTEIEKGYWNFNNSVLYKSEISSTRKNLLSIKKNPLFSK